MLQVQTTTRVEQFWAGYLGCTQDEFVRPGVKVLGGARAGSWFVMRYSESYLWHVHTDAVPAIKDALSCGIAASDMFSESFLRQIAPTAVDLLLGPATIGYTDSLNFRPGAQVPETRALTMNDAPALEQLAAACGAEAWEHAGIDLKNQPVVFGHFQDGQLVAAASYELWRNTIAHVGLVTAPGFRGRGLGKLVGARATAHALEKGLVPQWRTLVSNQPSVAVGRALGYHQLAAHYFVRLSPLS